MKSALFVDFDNVYSGLRRLEPAVADRFAAQPSRWMHWLSTVLVHPPFADDSPRRLLVRRVYLNPQVYQRFRPPFNRAGFEIIDCPAMTSEGKTSTDIHMVLDIVDLLQHETRIDEFIVFSADADFTPVLRKLRRWDRRTTVLAIGFPSAAYQASADLLIDADEFVRGALGVVNGDDSAPPGPPPDRARPAAPPPGSQSVAPVKLVADRVREEVARAVRPVPCARVAQVIAEEFAALASDWGGRGTFRRFMDSLDLAPLAIDWFTSGGLIFDPARMDPASDADPLPKAAEWGAESSLLAVAGPVHAATGAPLLPPPALRFLLQALADDLEEHAFALADTGKRVRDRCKEGGHAVSRSDVNFVLKGFLLSGVSLTEGRRSASWLAGRFVDNLVHLCRQEQFALDDTMERALREWAGACEEA